MALYRSCFLNRRP